MLTARDIQKKEFTKTRSAGYSIEEVDQFLDETAQVVAKLQSDKEELSSKTIQIAEKLEKIRDEQEIWRKSIITTQRSYEEVMTSAKIQAQDIIDKAKAEAAQIKADMQKEVNAMQAEIDALKEHKNELGDEVETFKKSLLSSYEKHIALIRDLSVMKREVVETPIEEQKTATEFAPIVETAEQTVEEPEEVMEPSVEDTQDTIVIPKDIFNDVDETDDKADETTDETADEISADVDEFLSKIDTSRVSFDKEDVLAEETVEEKEEPSKKSVDKKSKAFDLFADDFDKDESDENDEDDDDEEDEDEEHESVLKNLFSGAFSSRKKKNDEKPKRSRFFLGDDDDDDSDDFYDDEEE